MKNLPLILRALSIVAALAAVGLFFAAKGKLSEKQLQLQNTQANLKETKGDLKLANTQIGSLEAQVKAGQNELAGTKQKLESVRSEMYTARQEASQTKLQLTTTEKNVEGLKSQLSEVRSELVSTEKALKAASKEGEIAQLNERISELATSNETLTAQLETAQSERDAIQEKLLRAASRPSRPSYLSQSSAALPSDGAAAEPDALAATGALSPASSSSISPISIGANTKVTSIRAEDGLIVLANSEALALEPGQQIRLVKDLELLGTVQIVESNAEHSIANILPGSKTRALKPGTMVTLMR